MSRGACVSLLLFVALVASAPSTEKQPSPYVQCLKILQGCRSDSSYIECLASGGCEHPAHPGAECRPALSSCHDTLLACVDREAATANTKCQFNPPQDHSDFPHPGHPIDSVGLRRRDAAILSTKKMRQPGSRAEGMIPPMEREMDMNLPEEIEFGIPNGMDFEMPGRMGMDIPMPKAMMNEMKMKAARKMSKAK
jgi:hypothetical protein